MINEIKYIIAVKYNRLIHKKSSFSGNHYNLAKDNGINYEKEVIETGLIIDNYIIILTCKNRHHLAKRINKTSISQTQEKSRELKTKLDYGVYNLGGD